MTMSFAWITAIPPECTWMPILPSAAMFGSVST